MSNSGLRWSGTFTVFVVAFVLFFLWLLFSFTRAGHRVEVGVSAIVPRWLIFANVLILPCLTAVAAGPLRVRPGLRLVLAALALFSALILEVTFRRFPFQSCGVLAVFLLEVYWIIPKWDARHRRVP